MVHKSKIKTRRRKHAKKEFPIVPLVVIIFVAAFIGLAYYINQNQPVNDSTESVVALVNGEKIYLSKINEQYELIPEQLKAQLTKAVILNRTIDEVILVQEADNQGLYVSGEEVDDLIATLMEQNGITKDALDAQLNATGMTFEDLKEVYRKQALMTKLLNQTVLSKIEISNEDIEDYYNENIEDFALNKEVKARHILVDEEEFAIELLEKINNGEDFSELAMNYSQDPGSKAFGGDLGYFPEGMMVSEFNDAAFSMAINDSPKIVKTQFGYHIIDVTGIKEAHTQSLEDSYDAINLTLGREKEQEMLIEYLTNLRDTADLTVYWDKVLYEMPEGITTFQMVSEDICVSEGKPIINVFTTTTCPHCLWIKDTVDTVLKEYIDSGKIIAHHWILDSKDDLLTEEIETELPDSDSIKFMQNNPSGGVPMYDFGCKYIRLGNGFESSGNLEAEEAEFRAVIEDLLSNSDKFTEEVSEPEIIIQ